MDGLVLRVSPLDWMNRKTQLTYLRYHMLNGKTSLGRLDNSLYPTVKPKSVEQFLALHSKESLGGSWTF